MLIGLAISIMLARILGPTSLGRYQLGITIIQVATIFSVAGFDRGLIRYLPILKERNNSEARDLFFFNVQYSLVVSVALAAILYIAAPLLSTYYFHSEEMTAVLRIFAFYLPVFTIFRIASGGIIGIKRADLQSNITNMLSPVIFLSFLIMVYFYDATLKNCISARIITHLLIVFVLTCYLLKDLPKGEKRKDDNVRLTSFLSYSYSLMLIGLIYFLLGQMDIMMLGYFVTAGEIGIYSIALKVAIFIVFGLQVMLPIVAPHFSELTDRKDFKTLEALFKTSTKWLFYSGLFVFGPIVILRNDILSVFGEKFIAGGSVLLILGLGHLANTLSGPTGQLLIMTGKQKWEMINSIVMVVLNFCMNLFLIPRMGVIGAAIATAISIFLINLAKLAEVYIIFKIHPYSLKFIKGVLVVSLGCIVCYMSRWAVHGLELGTIINILLPGVAFCICTFAGIWIIGYDDDDRANLKKLRTHG